MEKIFNNLSIRKTRLHILCNLVFFAMIFFSCHETKEAQEVSIIKTSGQSVALFIPSELIDGLKKKDIEKELVVKINGQSENMLGEYDIDDSGVVFKPLIVFSPGSHYQVLFQGKVISDLSIPENQLLQGPIIDEIYPSADTLPENLLKLYLKFSRPMRQGVSEKYLTMLDSNGDTLRDIFLNLNTELWDEDGKQLTIWLNPGRIKRGLQPNENEGSPLRYGSSYTFSIAGEWADIRGNKLGKAYSKRFTARVKDIVSPKPGLWKLYIPAAGSPEPLAINFNESLDYTLLSNTIILINPDGEQIRTKMVVKNNERSLLIYPENKWPAGEYYLKTDTRLEDLAGNNLNRLFDRDILTDVQVGKEEFYTRKFVIK